MDFEIQDPAAAKQIFDADGALFVDVRNREMFAEGHIPDAVSLPIGEIEARLDDFAKGVPVERPIVTYCSGRLCQDSHTAAQLLMERGYQNVVVFIDGFPGWIENGYPVARQ
jgi:rhodanese-related sulfurtransferase